MLKYKITDKVKVTAGKDKGRDGVVEKIVKGSSVLIPGINEYKKHVKAQGNQKGGIFSIPKPLPFSKIALICPKCGKPTRVGFRIAGKEKVRFCKKCDRQIDKN
ncbi:MAG TPA: 50S ribosomal protein L24 [Patescibacteria group bacterium]|nr:50S ribosomal protein L24 [Patescibacteria group bacterium]